MRELQYVARMAWLRAGCRDGDPLPPGGDNLNAVLIAAVLKALEQKLLDGLAAVGAKLPDALKPAETEFAGAVKGILDAVDVAQLEQQTLGQLLELVKSGKSVASTSPIDFVG
jgi:4-aminobutyrate aminotransferase-like enzyme